MHCHFCNIILGYQLCVTIDSPITRYGQENRNRAARQRIPIRVWKDDDDGFEHVEVSLNNFQLPYKSCFRGPKPTTKSLEQIYNIFIGTL
ncbi:hypothetical protein Hdeb2414_s0002g00043171 [Helianthus debilis subsp. tardiflorus]